MSFRRVEVVQPLAVIRTDRHALINAISKAHQVCAVRIDAPKIGFGTARSAYRAKDDVASIPARSHLIHGVAGIGENDAAPSSRIHDSNVRTLDDQDLGIRRPVPTPSGQVRGKLDGS